MCNVFILGQVLTGIEICLYIANIVLTLIGGNLSANMIGAFVAIGCLILEFIGMKKKHSGFKGRSLILMGQGIFSIACLRDYLGWEKCLYL